jgi:spermidine synthase
VLYERFGHLAANSALMAALLFGSLLWPTFLMGTSLPLLSRALVHQTEGAAPTVGWLYAGNTLGAAIGALGATWILLPQRGMDGALHIAAGLNLACVIGAIPLALLANRTDHPAMERDSCPRCDSAVAATARFSLMQWMWLYALAGFIALSFEIVWFRVLGVMLKSTSVTFGTLLAQYLFWLGLGSAVGSIMARRLRHPAATFLWTQTAAGIYAGLVFVVCVRVLPDSSGLAPLSAYLGNFDPNVQPLRWYFILSAVVIGPATFLMGLSFPVLQRAVQTDFAHLGRRVGLLLVANIGGSTTGAVVTGWLLLATFGSAGTVRALVIASGLFGLLAAHAAGRTPLIVRARYAFVAVVIALVAFALPDGRTLWATLHGAPPRQVIAAEDGSGVSLLKASSQDFSRGASVFVNGLGQSWLPYGGIHTVLGALPAMLHPQPRQAAVIGLGSGDTLYALAGRRELEHIVSIELIGPQIDTLRELIPLYPYPALRGWLDDPRIEHVIDDGRAYLRDRGREYDILEADALRPDSAYAGNLYSDAYFRLLRDRLKPGGLAVTWVPTARVERTFLSVFPHAVKFGDVLIGSGAPIEIRQEAIERRLADPNVQTYYAEAGVNIRELIEGSLKGAVVFSLSQADRADIVDINTDLFPRDEFGR